MNNNTLNKLKPFLYGKLLGDANLERPKNGRQSRLKIEHSTKHREYVVHCYNILHNFSNKIFDRTRKLIYKNKVKVYKTTLLQSKALPAFTELFHLWYDESRKILPKDLEQYFTVETLAYWYMDDGYIHIKDRSSDIVFCTDSFNLNEVEYLIDIINKKFNLDAVLYKNKQKYRIRIGKKDKVEQFKKLVTPYILDILKYKVRDCNRTQQ